MKRAALVAMTMAAYASSLAAQAPQTQYPVPGGGSFAAPAAQQQPAIPLLPPEPAITPNGAVVEDVVARVNDQIITRSEYERSEEQLIKEAQQSNMSADELAEHQRNMLRDMIDQQLLLSKGKDLGTNCDAEVVRQLDEIRKQNHLDSMEDLQKAAEQQGVSFEDFKNNIRNSCITRQVVEDEVGRKLQLTHNEEEEYYKAHAQQFEQPEQVHLSEILVPTADTATPAELDAAKAKADDVAAKLKAGGKFADLAKQYSGGPTASAGGDLGDFKRGALGQVLEDATFSLPAGGLTAPIRTRQGYVLLRVDSHTQAGLAPLDTVETQVQNAIYVDQLQPALRAYLTKAREEAYVDIKPGFVDSGGTRKETKPVFTTYTPPPVKNKQIEHQRLEKEQNARAQQELAQAKANEAAKAARQAAKSGGVQNVSLQKPVKIHREKIRYGQAPRNALPPGPATESDGGAGTALPAGQAPGTAMTQGESTTVITSGTGVTQEDPLAPNSGPQKKTRYSAHQNDVELAKAQEQVSKAAEHAAAHPTQATSTQTATEKVQSGPLGLNGDTAKKVKPPKPAEKERLQEKAPASKAPAPAPIEQTVNPAIVTAPVPAQPAKSADQTTLPPVDSGAPGALPQSLPPATSPNPQPAPSSPQ